MSDARPDDSPLILHIVFKLAVGGLENGVVNLVNRMTPGRWRHGIVALTDISEEFSRRILRKDVIYQSLNKEPGHAVQLYPRLFRLFRRLRPAIVHTRNLAALEASAPAWAAGVPIRLHGEHGWDVMDLDGINRRHRMVRKLYRPFVHRYVALSKHLQTYLQERVGVAQQTISQIYNGVDMSRFRPAAPSREMIDGCPFTDSRLWLIGTVGRMQGVKDPANLAHAFVALLRRKPQLANEVRLIMVGDGKLRHDIQNILAHAGAAALAWLPGERADVPDIMRGLDCFVLPSLAEGISNTALEAMASGLSIVATAVGGNPELLEDGITGLLVPPGNSERLADAMLYYFEHRDTARQHGYAARAAAEQRFSLERMVAEYEELYSDLLAEHVHLDARVRGR